MSSGNRVIIIGAGIAGCSLAFYLSRIGWQVTIYDKGESLANGASGNQIGIIHPRIDSEWSDVTNFYYQAFKHLLALIEENDLATKIGFQKVGAVIISKNARDEKKFHKIAKFQKSDYVRLVSPTEASQIAGVTISTNSLFLPHGGYLNVRKFCEYLATHQNITFKFNIEIIDFKHNNEVWEVFSNQGNIDKAPALIIANAFAANQFKILSKLKITRIRGQLTYLPTSYLRQKIKSIICYGGYIIPEVDGHNHVGATFDRNLTEDYVIEASHIKNIELLKSSLSELIDDKIISSELSGRTSFRCYCEDKLPVVGNFSAAKGLYLSIGHGSRGILSAPISAQMIVAQLVNKNLPIYVQSEKLLSPNRLV